MCERGSSNEPALGVNQRGLGKMWRAFVTREPVNRDASSEEQMHKRSTTIVAIAQFLGCDVPFDDPKGYRFLKVGGKVLAYYSDDIDRLLALIDRYMDQGMSFCPVAFDARKMTPEHQLPSRWLWTHDTREGDILKAWTPPNVSILTARHGFWSMWNTGKWETRTNAMNEAIAKQIGGRVEMFVPVPFTGGATLIGNGRRIPVEPPRLPVLRGVAPQSQKSTTGSSRAPASGNGSVVSGAKEPKATQAVAQLLKKYEHAKSKKGVPLRRYFDSAGNSAARYALAMTLGEHGAAREDIVALVSAAGGDRRDAERLAAKACR
jgi:hypothetical protein